MKPPLTVIARILRVNHGGEFGAIRIYRAQIALARLRCPDLIPFLTETLAHEEEHLRRFLDMMPSRDGRPCRLMWLWGGGGAVLGFVTGLGGRQAVLVCTEAVERTVHRHLDDQVRHLDDRDAELAAAIRGIQTEELGHLRFAMEQRAPKRWVDHALDAMIVGFTESFIWLSTRGDSFRLARELTA